MIWVVGVYVIVVIDCEDKNKLVVVWKGSLFVIGVGEGEFFMVFDVILIIEYIKKVVYFNDEEIVVVIRDGYFEVKIIVNEV